MKEHDTFQIAWRGLVEGAGVVGAVANRVYDNTKPVVGEFTKREVLYPLMQALRDTKARVLYRRLKLGW